MRLLFLDESGRIGEDGLFALGGVTVQESDWHDLRAHWLAPLTAHGWDPTNEVKWHGIRTGRVPPALADAVVDGLSRAPFTAYVTLLDLEAGVEIPEFFGSPEQTYGTALMFVSERFHHLLEAEDELGLVVVDSRHREEDDSIRRFFGALTETGTPYMRLDRIVEGLFLGPSHLSIGLQCADLIVSISAAAERGNGLALGYLRKLEPRFATHPATGELDGVGFKRFPEPPRGRAPLLMDALAVLAIAIAVAIGVAWLSARRRRRRDLRGRPADRPEDFAGLFAAGLPLALSPLDDETRPEADTGAADLEELDLEEGALDPDELYDDPLVWDEGVDDELG